MLQDVPNETEIENFSDSVTLSKSTTRIPQIVKLMVQGLNQTQIAEKLNVSRTTIWRDRASISWELFSQELIDTHLTELAELEKDPKTRIAALKERGLMIRAGIAKKVHQRVQKDEIKIILHDFKPQPKTVQANQETHEEYEQRKTQN